MTWSPTMGGRSHRTEGAGRSMLTNLGSRTGQTHGLLTRSVFGLGGSWIVSAFVLVAPLGWVGFQAGLMVQIWDGLYGWDHLFTLSLLFGGVMIMNNLLGFTGISAFARYAVAPRDHPVDRLPGDQGRG